MFNDKKRLNYEEYVQINQEISSEMFLSILTLLQSSLPCSVNFYRYKNNYEKYVGDEGKQEENKDNIKTIASPRLMSKLSPVANLVQNQNINVNPISQKGLLKYAMKQDKQEAAAKDSDESEDDGDFSKFESRKARKAEKEARAKQLSDLRAQGKDVIDESGAIRLPNRISKGVQIDPRTGTAKQGNDRDVIMSPTSFLQGAASPRLNSFMTGGEENCV